MRKESLLYRINPLDTIGLPCHNWLRSLYQDNFQYLSSIKSNW